MVMAEDDLITEYALCVVSADGRSLPALLRVDERRDALTLDYAGRRLDVADEDYFEAFCRMREDLEAEGLRPVCYGASRNVYPASMGRQMGGGWRAYRLTLGQPARIADLVDIFSIGPDVVPVPVAEQREFYSRWLDSLRKKR
jgi:hypothetical protein